MSIILASASPRRRQLMELITPDFQVCTSDVDESKITADNPKMLAVRLARAKCLAVAENHTGKVVIGCDTVVEISGEVLGKPSDEADAKRMIALLSGKTHFVHTGVCVCRNGLCVSFADTTRVSFDDIAASDIDEYVKTKEPYDKAGAYGIQGWAAKYTRSISGCYYNVMGFPVAHISRLLRKINVKLNEKSK